MKEHLFWVDRLPFYAAGQMDEAERVELEAHLENCADCRAELQEWMAISTAVVESSPSAAAPADLVNKAFHSIHRRSLPGMLQHAWQLLRVQMRLVVPELWPAAAAVMAIGVAVAWIANKEQVIYFLAPMVAAACLAVISGPEYDPAVELTCAAPTPQAVILLARLTLVAIFNLILALAASAFVLPLVPAGMLSSLILSWLGPLAFLSALALVLSQWIGAGNALVTAYALWLVRFIPFQLVSFGKPSPTLEHVLAVYQQFWSSTPLLLSLGAVLFAVAFWSANHSSRRTSAAVG